MITAKLAVLFGIRRIQLVVPVERIDWNLLGSIDYSHFCHIVLLTLWIRILDFNNHNVNSSNNSSKLKVIL